ncbi:MAG: DUF2155 domain-containing protein [Pseudomonadota bacterium]
MRFFVLLFLISFIPSHGFASMTDYPQIRLQALDKSTARTQTLEANVGDTIRYGSLFIKIQACRQSDPLDKPENAAFLQIWEIPIGKTKSEWIFSGWMFSSSPAVSAMDHAVYDIWVLECVDPDKSTEIENRVIVTTGEDEEFIDSEAEETTSEDAFEEQNEQIDEEIIEEANTPDLNGDSSQVTDFE